MGDAYWRYADARQQQPPMAQIPLKRPRSDYDIPAGHELPSYFSRENERAGYRMVPENDSIGASYDRYLRSGQITSYGAEPGRPITGEMIDDRRGSGVRGYDPVPLKTQHIGISSGKPENSLPNDASNTLFVEGLPADCTRREVSHIFRPFVGFKEVRLVNKEARHSGGDPVVLCFVDFGSPAEAATAMDALQGTRKFQCSSSAEAELMAIQLGMDIAKMMGNTNFLIISDSLACINDLNTSDCYLDWNLKESVDKLKAEASFFDFCQFVFAPRSLLTAAHFLASHARNGHKVIADHAVKDLNFCKYFVTDMESAPLLHRGTTDIKNLCNFFTFV